MSKNKKYSPIKTMTIMTDLVPTRVHNLIIVDSRERYNCCVAEAAPIPIGKFFEEDEN